MPKDEWSLLEEGARELGVSINAGHVAAFKKYLDELTLWNEKINLTARGDRREIILKDFIDSLSLVKYVDSGARVLDIGSGAGFPGIPLKIVRPDVTVVLLEANRKKHHFLKNVIRLLELEGIEASWTEDKRDLPPFDLVVSRAFGPLVKFAVFGAPHLAAGGLLLAMKGKKGEEELIAALPELAGVGLAPAFVDVLRLPVLGHERVIVGIKKTE